MKYYGLRVYDIAESIVASGYPMNKTRMTEREFENQVKLMNEYLNVYGIDELIEKAKAPKEERDHYDESWKIVCNNIRRSLNLGGANNGSGHDSYLKGILVNVNITADQSFWLQWERYAFQDTISSMSTMHCLCKFENLDSMFSKYTDPRTIAICKEYINEYIANPTPKNFHKVIHNCPEGIELTRRVTTNYLQFKTMLTQREFHKMFSWSEDFVILCGDLPYFYELIGRV